MKRVYCTNITDEDRQKALGLAIEVYNDPYADYEMNLLAIALLESSEELERLIDEGEESWPTYDIPEVNSDQN